jgi:hypothetical protein
MADWAAWAAVGVSAVAVGITIAQWIQSHRWRDKQQKRADEQQKRIDQLAQEQAITDVRRPIDEIVTAWNNTMISQPIAVFDSDLPPLADRARQWRDDVRDPQTRLLAHTGGSRSYAYRLVQDNVSAVMNFGAEVTAIMAEELDQQAKREKVQRSVVSMQTVANRAIDDLDNLRGEALLRP